MLPDFRVDSVLLKPFSSTNFSSAPVAILLRLELGAFFLRGFVELFPSHPKKFSTASQ